MDFEKLKQWMEVARKYQSGDFWNGMLDQSSFNQFMKENMDMGSSAGPGPNAGANSLGRRPYNSKFPSIDIYMTDLEIIVLADLAGYKKEDLQVSVSGNKLLLKGTSSPIVSGQAIVQERNQGAFQRIIDLPEPTDSNQIKAKFQNGLLTLTYKRLYIQEETVPIE
ncbi:Hsp20/alpha crystallin family protein [Cytobacillus depressus]|uniref:Hsp20/alpha crystallin family protein n=1 Tax=Cytobacillus depressus TaxID=1602942 RepID=A0A6L3V3K0_9BACI|nr:Hsp20/alpha crystallin family protein [Cytobacillus depressus]KAB2331506.1 Hsp20/alpha crystallin family protein [Cytobacillus depressus]